MQTFWCLPQGQGSWLAIGNAAVGWLGLVRKSTFREESQTYAQVILTFPELLRGRRQMILWLCRPRCVVSPAGSSQALGNSTRAAPELRCLSVEHVGRS